MIGIFDSGFGGLTTLRELLRILPQYSYVFLGDQARTPYGNRSPETVTQFTSEGVDFLFSQGAKIVLIACNTASADALRHLQKKYGAEQKVLGALIPAMEESLQKSRYGRIGLIATRGTIEAKNYDAELEKLWQEHYKPQEKKAFPKPKLYKVAAPLLVPLIEEGWSKKPETKMILKKYVMPLKHAHVDTLILGCTHYPLLEKQFLRKMGKSCSIINSGKAQAEAFAQYLKRHPEIERILQNRSSQDPTVQFFTTDSPERFQKLGQQFLGQKIKQVHKAAL